MQNYIAIEPFLLPQTVSKMESGSLPGLYDISNIRGLLHESDAKKYFVSSFRYKIAGAGASGDFAGFLEAGRAPELSEVCAQYPSL